MLGEIMSSSILIWKDSMKEVYKGRISVFLSFIVMQFMVILTLLLLITTGIIIFLVLFIIVLLLDIYYIRKMENVYPLVIYNDKIFYTDIDTSIEGPSMATTHIVRYNEIQKIEPIKDHKQTLVGDLLFSAGGKNPQYRSFKLHLKDGKQIILNNHYVTELDKAHYHLTTQFKKYHGINN
jgi:hypothetical protein